MTNIELAIMAGRSYQSTRQEVNWFPVPNGWTEFFHVPNITDYPAFNGSSGFEAVSFQRANEIVISFAGTYEKDIAGDVAADIALGNGHYTEQLKEAAEYYLQVKSAKPDAQITLTGHSLGGGLASLIAVFFDEEAFTFDQAPFRLTAANLALQAALDTLTSQYGGGDFLLTEPQSEAIIRQIIDGGVSVSGFLDYPVSQGKQARLDARLGNTETTTVLAHNSNEYVVVMSLFYNGEGTVPANGGLVRVIRAGDRAEAWYEIRYKTNRNALTAPSNMSSGVANRCYEESDLFGLYKNDAFPDMDDAALPFAA